MRRALLFSFVLIIGCLFSMNTIKEGEVLIREFNTQEGIYLNQHTQIHPNIIKDYFYVESTDGINIENFIVYDLTGKQIMFLNDNTNSTIDIDTSVYNSGMYLLQIASENATIFKEIVVEN